MRVLILGASGLLGSSLSPYLLEKGFHVLRHGNKVTCEVSCDLTIFSETDILIERTRPDAIVNLVAQTNVDHCESNVHNAYLINVKTVENLVLAMSRYPHIHLVHISTDHVYDGRGPNDENNTRLSNIYSLTKYAGEIAARNVPHTILRTNFFGKSLLPERTSFSDWLVNNLRTKKTIKVFDDIVINPVSIKTLCEIIKLALEKKIQGTYNIGSHGALSKADIAFALAGIFDFDTTNLQRGLSSEAGLLAYRPQVMTMDCSKFEDVFKVRLPSLFDEITQLKGVYSEI